MINIETWFDEKKLLFGMDTEEGQARVRLVAACSFMIYLLSLAATGPFKGNSGVLTAGTLYLAFSAGWLGILRVWRTNPEWRRALASFLDYAIFALTLFEGGAAMAPLAWVPICFAIGSGLRYGYRQEIISRFLGVVCVGSALAYSPFWRSISPLVGWGAGLALVVVPWYALRLTDLIKHRQQQAESREAHAAQLKQKAEHGRAAAERLTKEAEQGRAAAELQSKTDLITGGYTRRVFDVALESMLKLVREPGYSGERFAVMMADLDGFKKVNDSGGHLAGNEILKRVYAEIKSALRASDIVVRWGGDEYAILVRNLATDENAENITRNILESVAAIRLGQHPDLTVKASIGICMLPNPYVSNSAEIIAFADKLMYEAKICGKNQYKISTNFSFINGECGPLSTPSN